MAKHILDSNPAPKRRVKPTPMEKRPFKITNLSEEEVIHQACLIIHGECHFFDYAEETNFVSVTSSDLLHQSQTSDTHWPLNKGLWKALVMLSPGLNALEFKLHHAGGIFDSLRITVNYLPLLQLPPLHLAILVAKDSPLLIDCPPAKYGSISTAHSGIDAAVAKLRMSAYMWQALSAEDFRQKGLGRRSFRLDEEWTPNSTMQATHQSAAGMDIHRHMGAVAKVHIIRSERTVAELRGADIAQQNPHGKDRDALHRYFEEALITSGPPFESKHRPVVAGMILDAHYSPSQSLITAHAALGSHKADGISLGIFGSHLAYSWPRFMEEIPHCLMDMTSPGDNVGNDNGECNTMRGACFVGQGAFLHEVGHAFGAGHTTGIMERGYSDSWGMNFIEDKTNNGITNGSKWDLQDALKFKLLPHWRLPGDDPISKEFRNASLRIEVDPDRDNLDDMEDLDREGLRVSCTAGLAEVIIRNGDDEPFVHDFITTEGTYPEFRIMDIRSKFDETKQLQVAALGMNGAKRVVKDAWKLLAEKPYIRIPGSSIMLRKKAVTSHGLDRKHGDNDSNYVRWARLLKRRGEDGNLHRANSIDLRVGCIMDGAVVYYADGRFANCGPSRDKHTGQPHQFGGHASEQHLIPDGATITQVKICHRNDGWGALAGIRMTLSNGEEWGYLNDSDYSYDSDSVQENVDQRITTLEPDEDEEIIGFYGRSVDWSGFTHEFGIVTGPKGVELPANVYSLSELTGDEQ